MATDNCITIPLTRGFSTKISPIDSDLASVKWTTIGTNKNPYAWKPPNKLHRLIMGRILGRPLTRFEFVDHIDNDGLNNTRENLRLATPGENCRNRGAQENSTTGFKGVTQHKNRFRSQIQINNKRIHLGLFDTPEQAHEAYCKASAKYHGEFGRTQ